jgi:hypothetical protein
MIDFIFFVVYDTSPPSLNNLDFADNILGLVNILPCDVAPEYFLDPYSCSNHLWFGDRHA